MPPPTPPERRLFWLSATLALVLTGLLAAAGAPLQTPTAPLGMVSFELAGSLPRARAILDGWDEPARLWAAFSLGLDFLYIPAYAVAIALAARWAAGALGRFGRGWTRAGLWIARAQVLAALLDAVENVALLTLLLGAGTGPWARIALLCAAPKFALVISGLLWSALGLLLRAARRNA